MGDTTTVIVLIISISLSVVILITILMTMIHCCQRSKKKTNVTPMSTRFSTYNRTVGDGGGGGGGG